MNTQFCENGRGAIEIYCCSRTFRPDSQMHMILHRNVYVPAYFRSSKEPSDTAWFLKRLPPVKKRHKTFFLQISFLISLDINLVNFRFNIRSIQGHFSINTLFEKGVFFHIFLIIAFCRNRNCQYSCLNPFF